MKTLPSAPISETHLVAASIAGDRSSFGSLVSRHQAAVSGVAYSICGDFAASEDLAQEAFVAAWKQLPELQEPSRFRAWVCGIARMLSLNYVRRRSRHQLDTPADTTTLTASDISPVESATSEEEKALLWRTLEKLPENYREPLVLFYREQKSITQVAAALELSEEVIKQRLSRGRVLLRDELAGVLESTLFRTRPGVAFTTAVLTALPPVLAAAGIAASAGTAKAATVAGAATHAASASTTASVVSISFLGTLASAVVSLLGIYIGIRTWRRTHIDRAVCTLLFRFFAFSTAAAGIFAGAFAWVVLTKNSALSSAGFSIGAVLTTLALSYVALQAFIAASGFLRLQTVLARAAETEKKTPLIEFPLALTNRRYQSRARFLGLPLISVAQGPDITRGERIGIARGWIAIGDVAFGGLMSIGGVGIAPISLAGLGLGVVSTGGVALGALALGGASFGYLSCGGLAFGWQLAVGGLAFAREMALGGIAVAHDIALGGLAYALNANTQSAWETVQAHPMAQTALHWLPYTHWLSLLAVPSLIIAFRRMRSLRHQSPRLR
ncbi:MAG: sigma-70 family RNA polymerase sigma factor [Nibricoccus sp.]